MGAHTWFINKEVDFYKEDQYEIQTFGKDRYSGK